MKHYFNSSIKTLLAILALGFCASCSDDWDDHYSVDPNVVPDMSILKMLESDSQTSNFVKVLQTTKTYNGKKVVDAVNYYDLLGSDQFLTAWAPVNSAIPDSLWKVYMKENKTEEENYLVSQRFLKNHIARFNNPVGKDGIWVTMMSTKRYKMATSSIQHAGYILKNQACTNGILHVIDKGIDYSPNLYEYITTDPQYKDNLGEFFASYTKYEIDEEKSVPAGIVDGRTVYVDSVLIETSILLDKYGFINREDSNYVVVLPSGEAYKTALDNIKDRFLFANPDYTQEEQDSLQRFYANCALLTDAFFNTNKNTWSLFKSLDGEVVPTTTFENYRKSTENTLKYHYYYKPFDLEVGDFAPYNPEIIECSNGNIYLCQEWPFEPEMTYDAPIVREAELTKGRSQESTTTSTDVMTIRSIKNIETIFPSDISEGKVLLIKGAKAITDKWQVTFGIYDNLAGYYNIYAIIAPNSINGDIVPAKPNIFSAEIDYYDENGKYQSFIPRDEKNKAKVFNNDITKLDTMLIAGGLYIPACNLGQTDARVELVLNCKIANNKTKEFSNTMLLDAIYLEPTEAPVEEPAE